LSLIWPESRPSRCHGCRSGWGSTAAKFFCFAAGLSTEIF
jgi:hypothetical protein